jgi:hypothetical protein
MSMDMFVHWHGASGKGRMVSASNLKKDTQRFISPTIAQILISGRPEPGAFALDLIRKPSDGVNTP